jgi:acyl transferase domain-containing protein
MAEKSKTNGKKPAQSRGIAIVGMSCIFPGAAGLDAYWQNIVSGVDAIREPRDEEWNANKYKNKSGANFGKIYCTRGGFITEYAEFDPLEFGIMPASLKGGDPDQFLSLRVAAEALADAGYQHKTFKSERADVIIGRTMAPGVGSMNLIQHGQTIEQVLDIVRAVAPQLSSEQLSKLENDLHNGLNPCTADTIPAVMPNILSGRIASKLGFQGRNMVLDSACASSLIAVEAAIDSLESGKADIALAGGVHINSSPYFYQMFCELGALSSSGVIRPFDEDADGTMLGEGVGMLVLKRLDDALHDGNKIYAVIKGIGSSGDGHSGGNLAPNVEGEALAMQRAYTMAEIEPDTVDLLEAHGTGTPAGDLAEMKAVHKIFGANAARKSYCAIGSVKSMIGHTQAASGIAGLIKVALALHNKVLPPTLNVRKASSKINWENSPCYINDKARPWKKPEHDHLRRAAVSAFGFGGVNAHAVLEEFPSESGATQTAQAIPAKGKSRAIKLSLRFPELSAQSVDTSIQMPSTPRVGEKPIPVSAIMPAHRSSSSIQSVQAIPGTQEHPETVLSGYFQALGEFQKRLLSTQEAVIDNYLSDPGNE